MEIKQLLRNFQQQLFAGRLHPWNQCYLIPDHQLVAARAIICGSGIMRSQATKSITGVGVSANDLHLTRGELIPSYVNICSSWDCEHVRTRESTFWLFLIRDKLWFFLFDSELINKPDREEKEILRCIEWLSRRIFWKQREQLKGNDFMIQWKQMDRIQSQFANIERSKEVLVFAENRRGVRKETGRSVIKRL